MENNYTLKNNYSAYLSLKNRHLFTFILFFVFCGIQLVQGQKIQKLPGPIVVCPANYEDQNSRMAMSQMAAVNSSFSTGIQAATAELLVTFGPEAQANPEVVAAFQFALDIWSEEIISIVPIRIFAEFADLGPGVLASAGPTSIFSDFEGAPKPGVFYPAALADALAGVDLDPEEEFDLVVNLGNGIPWYFGTDGNTPAGFFDFVTVALHEAGHGLGFVDGGDVDDNGVGFLGFAGGVPIIFDTFIVDGDGNSVLDFPNPSLELGDFYTSGNVFVNGSLAVAALGGTLPELFAPNPFQGGSSIAHWDEAAFPAGDPNSLMSPQIGASESNFNIGDITRGHFSDMGWQIAGAAPIAVSPASISDEINVDEVVIRELTVTNVTDAPVVVTLSTTLGSLIELFEPDPLIIGISEAVTLQVQFNASGIEKGIYTDAITLTTEGFDRTVEIPITLRVIDGTEAPLIAVSPESYSETIDQFQVISRELSIENSGDDDLNYSLIISDGSDESTRGFDDRVILTNEFISAEGFNVKNYQASATSQGLSSYISAGNGILNSIVTDLFSADFENYATGTIDGQFGWFVAAATETDDWVVTDTNAFEGNQHLSSVSDGLGGTRLAFTPLITPGNEPFMITSAKINIQGNGTTWEIIPQSPNAESVVTRVRFNADRSIDILDSSASAFIPIDTATPQGYFDLRIVVDKDDAAMRVFIDDQLVFSGTGFASEIEQLVFLTPMEAVGSTMDIDNVEIIDGDVNAFFLTVSPTTGVVPFGTTRTAAVKFDARSLTEGVYNATINVTSNDETNPTIEIPVTLTVKVPPRMAVSPEAISAAVDVRIDDPAIARESFVITNTGDSELNFTTGLGATVFSPPSATDETHLASVNMSKYGVGNLTKFTTLKRSGKSIDRNSNNGLNVVSKSKIELQNARVYTDSIFYDNGENIPDDFVGLNDGTAVSLAVKFDAESAFTLSAVRNSFRTEALSEATIILEVIRGGATPDAGELLLSQNINTISAEGIFLEEILNVPQQFDAGESFWVVHKYPEGIDFPQGFFETDNVRPDTYFFSSDGGASYTNLTNFAFLTRALSGGDEGNYITLEPSSGTVAPGQSFEVSISFNGTTLANGTFETDVLVNSNDPVNPTTSVATSFEISGQVSGIEVSDELLTFNDVFIGNSNKRTFTISNSGFALLNVSNITSDNEDFSVNPTSAVIAGGEEQEITVAFTPSTIGSINGIISITSDAPDSDTPIVIVNGIGVDPPTAILDPLEVFEIVDTGKTVDTEITLSNDGSSPLTFSFPELTMSAALQDPTANISSNAKIIEFNSSIPKKGIKDARTGAKVLNSMGKDNEFGYTWIDNDEEGGPVYSFFDISGIGLDATEILGGDGTAELDLPFSFDFYGSIYNSIFVNANGFLAFQLPENLTYFNGQIPEDDNINNIIAGMWVDLEPQEFNGSLHLAAFSDAFIVQWTDVPVFLGSAEETVTFQIVVFADGTIDVYYADVESAPFRNFSTVGIENADATDGAQVAFNTPYIKDGLALRFIRPEIPLKNFISNVSPISGVIPAGGSRTLTVTLDATNLAPDVYYDELTVSSNAPDKSTGTSLIELTVLDLPTVTSFTLVNAETNEEIGPLVESYIIDLADFSSNSFSIVANVGDGPVGSIVFDLNDTLGFQTENFAPYSLAGDTNGNFNAVAFPLGRNSVTATPFSERAGGGDVGEALMVNFAVIDTRVREVTSFTLINAETNEEIGALDAGKIIDLADFTSNSFSVKANVGSAPVRSVVFDFNGTIGFQTENFVPYALAGDNNGNFNSVAFPLGSNSVTATPFSERAGGGDVGEALMVNFEVIDSSLGEVLSFTLINAETNEELGALEEGRIIDLADFTSNSFNVQANVGEVPVRSVVFDFNGTIGFQTENVVPYALAGDRNGIFRSIALPLGSNTVKATPFSKRAGKGDAGTPLMVTFVIVDTSNSTLISSADKGSVYPNPVKNVTQFTLEGTSKQMLKGTLHNIMGQVVNESFDFEVNEFGSAPLDMTSLPQGIYILKLRDTSGKIVSQVRLIKE